MKVIKIETNLKRGLYLKQTEIKHLKPYENKPEDNILNVYTNLELQEILGFGGAFTDSTCYVLNKISEENKNKILDNYFDKVGLDYSICRLTIGSSDFNQKSYSYSYTSDLSDFSINEDLNYIIPIIKQAQERNKDLKFIASPWSPPAYMKSNKMLKLGGRLIPKYYSNWAEYLARYVMEYKKYGITIDYMTIQNEPNATQIWESCKFSAEQEAVFLKEYLYPTFQKYNLPTKFLVWDHNKDNIVNRNIDTLVKYGALNYAAGIAYHWYTGTHYENLQILHNLFPNKLLIHTEGCTGYSKFKPEDELFNAQMYASQIIGDFNSSSNAFIDWNMVLDYHGGPNHLRNYCNSPIMMNKDNTEIIYTPTYYYLAHFCKYINPHAKRIAFSRFTENIEMTAFKNIDNSIVIVLLNKNKYNIEYNLCFNGQYFHDNLDSNVIVTFVIN